MSYVPEFDPEKSGAIAVGIDVIEIERIQHVLDDFGERFLQRCFTEYERARFRNRIEELAGRFAVKEATSKALGTGIRGIRWREMETQVNRRGNPVGFARQAKARAELLGFTDFSVSITHSRTDAMAIVVALKERTTNDEELERRGRHHRSRDRAASPAQTGRARS